MAAFGSSSVYGGVRKSGGENVSLNTSMNISTGSIGLSDTAVNEVLNGMNEDIALSDTSAVNVSATEASGNHNTPNRKRDSNGLCDGIEVRNLSFNTADLNMSGETVELNVSAIEANDNHVIPSTKTREKEGVR